MPAYVPLAAALALSAAAASAQPANVRQHYSLDGHRIVAETAVPYRDIDLASAAGAQALRDRIEAAAEAVCGPPAPAGEGYQREARLTCKDAAVRGALARLPPASRARLAAAR